MSFTFRPVILTAASVIAFAASSAQAATLTGAWLFDDQANVGKAAVGTDLVVNGAAPAWSATLADDTSASQSGVVTTVGGAPNGFTATHNIPANGGGGFVNEYSILADIFSPAGSRGAWRTIFQTNTGNANDGDYFIRNDTDLMGTASLTYSTNPINEAKWSRLVLTFDLEPAPAGSSVIRAYIDGALVHTHSSTSNELLRDGRFSLDPNILFFRDNDGDNASMNVGALAIWNGALTGPEVAALGAAGATIPEPGLSSLAFLSLGALTLRRRRNS